MFGLELVRVIEVPKEIVKEQVEVRVPVYETFAVCNHDQELRDICSELAYIKKILQTPIPEQIVLHSTREGWEMGFGKIEAWSQRTRPDSLVKE